MNNYFNKTSTFVIIGTATLGGGILYDAVLKAIDYYADAKEPEYKLSSSLFLNYGTLFGFTVGLAISNPPANICNYMLKN